jgi:hypothetical protein
MMEDEILEHSDAEDGDEEDEDWDFVGNWFMKEERQTAKGPF